MNTRPIPTSLLLLSVTLAGCAESGPAASNHPPTPTQSTPEQSEPSMTKPDSRPRQMILTREFDAPVDQVWHAWSDADHLMRWWGPKGFTSPSCGMDFRVGGRSLVCMRAPKEFGGQDMYNTWSYTKIVPQQRIEFTHHFTDKSGNRLDPAAMGLPPGIPMEIPHMITFKPLAGDRTEMTVTESGYTTDQAVEISRAGLVECLDKMAESFKPHEAAQPMAR